MQRNKVHLRTRQDTARCHDSLLFPKLQRAGGQLWQSFNAF
jgi:hypothetical protein